MDEVIDRLSSAVETMSEEIGLNLEGLIEATTDLVMEGLGRLARENNTTIENLIYLRSVD